MDWKKKNEERRRTHQGGLKILFGMGFRVWHYNKDKLSYITPYYSSQQVCKYANYLYNKDTTRGRNRLMWDMFGGIGTDSIFMSHYFNLVTSEIDYKTYELLKYNVEVHNIKNINLLRVNCLGLLNMVYPDVVYFDPPWGENYRSKMMHFDFGQVYIDCPIENYGDLPKKVNCIDLLRFILKNLTTNVIVKAPMNSMSFENNFSRHIKYIYRYQGHNLKFLFLE